MMRVKKLTRVCTYKNLMRGCSPTPPPRCVTWDDDLSESIPPQVLLHLVLAIGYCLCVARASCSRVLVRGDWHHPWGRTMFSDIRQVGRRMIRCYWLAPWVIVLAWPVIAMPLQLWSMGHLSVWKGTMFAWGHHPCATYCFCFGSATAHCRLLFVAIDQHCAAAMGARNDTTNECA